MKQSIENILDENTIKTVARARHNSNIERTKKDDGRIITLRKEQNTKPLATTKTHEVGKQMKRGYINDNNSKGERAKKRKE